MRRKFVVAGASTVAAVAVATTLVLIPGSAAGVTPGVATAPAGSPASVVTTTVGPTPADNGKSKPATAECREAGRLDRRWERVEKRLTGPAGQKGSIAWVKQEAADAAKAGQTVKAAELTRRADRMSHRLSVGTSLTGSIGAAVKADC